MKLTPLILLTLSAAVCHHLARATTLAQIHDRGFVVAGIVSEPSPFGGIADGRAIGFDAALIDEFARSAQLEVRQRSISPDEVESALRSGTVDLVASSVEVTPRLQASMRFAVPVAEATRYYLKRKGDDRLETIGDLSGKRFATLSSSAGVTEMAELEHRLAKAGGQLGQPVEYPTYQQACEALMAQQIDYLVGDVADLEVAVKDHPNDLEIGEPVSQTIYVAWATATDSPEIAARISDVLTQARKSGELAALQRKFLGREFPDLPESVSAKDWWVARDKPAVFPIPAYREPD